MGSTSALHSERYAAFLQRLKQARRDSGLTQRQVAERLSRPQSFVAKSEIGSRRVDAAELFEYAKVLGKKVTYFDPES